MKFSGTKFPFSIFIYIVENIWIKAVRLTVHLYNALISRLLMPNPVPN